ncbi:hypothetical protein ACA910_014998 [Epithemia clementina (nom. ined.)]
MLPLRHLVILVDPQSRTLPVEIVNRWRPFLSIELWYNNQTNNPNTSTNTNTNTNTNHHPTENTTNNSGGVPLRKEHRLRQSSFYRQCTRYLRQRNRTWVSFHDADEYVYLDPGAVPNARDRMNHPGSILRFLHDITKTTTTTTTTKTTTTTNPNNNSNKKKNENSNSDNHQAAAGGRRTNHHHTIRGDRTLLRYGAEASNRSCLVMARTFFGSTESRNQTRVQTAHVPRFLNGTHFETLRWLRRNTHQDPGNGHGKSMVHVGALVPSLSLSSSAAAASRRGPTQKATLPFVRGVDKGVHRVVEDCPTTNHAYSPIRIRHYVGSWEVYNSRMDVRRSPQLYEYRSQFGSYKNNNNNNNTKDDDDDDNDDDDDDDDVRMWLTGFCKLMGNNQTLIQNLLQGAGHIPPQQQQEQLLQQSLNQQQQEEYAAAQWALAQDEIKTLLTTKRDPNNKFIQWLRQHYKVKRLLNGTLVVVKQDE